MSDVRTIYLVTSGEYSDYSVWCAFDSEADAEEYCRRWVQAETERQQRREGSVYIWEKPEVDTLQLWAGVPILGESTDGYSIVPRTTNEPSGSAE